MIKVLFFASLKEQLGSSSIELPLSNNNYSVSDVIQAIIELQPNWQAHLKAENLLVAINQTMAEPTAQIKAGDEVAIFPPVTGG